MALFPITLLQLCHNLTFMCPLLDLVKPKLSERSL